MKIIKYFFQEYLGFENELEPIIVVKKPLDFETVNNFTIKLRVQDQGSPPLYSDTTLQVTVLDADDQNPKFTYEHYTALLPDDAEEVRDLLPYIMTPLLARAGTTATTIPPHKLV